MKLPISKHKYLFFYVDILWKHPRHKRWHFGRSNGFDEQFTTYAADLHYEPRLVYVHIKWGLDDNRTLHF